MGLLAAVILLGLVAAAQTKISSYHRYVVSDLSELEAHRVTPATTIIFGSGVDPAGQPRPVLKQRLDAGISLYRDGYAEAFIVSGHVSDDYSEPVAMAGYLHAHGVPREIISLDRNGDNTDRTCRQANGKFGLDKALLVTQPSHLDRAIFLCRTHSIEAYGYPAKFTGTQTDQNFQSLREGFSNVKALFSAWLGN